MKIVKLIVYAKYGILIYLNSLEIEQLFLLLSNPISGNRSVYEIRLRMYNRRFFVCSMPPC
jgi:hypothetical protein